MTPKVLIVDDDKNLLDTMRRGLCRRYELVTAAGPEEGFQALKDQGPFAVVLSDLRMPGIDGVRFLEKVKELYPATVRMMFTGHGDLEAAMAAVNEGSVFRFMTKPCPVEIIIRSLDAGIEQNKLVLAEKELLRGTLRGCVKVLVDVLNLVNPEAFSRGERVKRMMLAVAKRMGIANTLKLELAGMLSQIGMVAVPQEIVFKRFRGAKLSPEEDQIYRFHASVAATLLSQIPRMKDVVDLIGCQKDCVDQDSPLSTDAVILNLSLDYDDLEQIDIATDTAIEDLRRKWESKDPRVFKAFLEVIFSESGYIPGLVKLKDLHPGMILKQDIFDEGKMLIMAKGQEVSDVACIRLMRMQESFKLPVMISVLIPLADKETA